MKILIGPFDGRKKRSRCLACAASHLKCSGNAPCDNCQRKRVNCTFQKQNPNPIRIDYAECNTKIDARLDCPVPCRSTSPRLTINPSNDQTHYLSHHFNIFLQRNTINPETKVSVDVISLMKDQVPGGFLHHAVLSVGAMQAVKLNSSEGINSSQAYSLAISHYSKSVGRLRQALDRFHQQPSSVYCVLWTTHLLGLFELMADASGAGWVQHLVHGTSKALIAAGPTVCQSALGQRFFTEVRMFEACRAIIFNEPTFLTSSDWKCLTETQNQSHRDFHGLNALLDIIVSCSTLRVRVRELLYSSETHVQEQIGKTYANACDIALESFRLRQALIDWKARRLSLKHQMIVDNNMAAKSFSCLAEAMWAATSIYLSGVFDYEMPYWKRMSVVPTYLGEEEIQGHVNNILTHTNTVLYNSSISPLLVLFPLRVAGARLLYKWQQDCITQSLLAVETTFPVATTFRTDLRDIWNRKGLIV